MKILTHNMICCLKCDHFPLRIKAEQKEEQQQEENFDFIKHILTRVDYPALKLAASDLAIQGLPDQLPENITDNEIALKSLHKLLLEVTVVEGELVCENCGRAYPIKNKIANMVLREDELLEKQKKVKSDAKQAYEASSSAMNQSEDISQE